MSGRAATPRDDELLVRDALVFLRDCGDRPGMYDAGDAALAALDRLVAENERLAAGIRVVIP